jgi:DUF1680 family protein
VTIACTHDLPVMVRLPSYANTPSFTKAGRPVDAPVHEGYAHLILHANTPIEIDMHVTPQWMAAHPQVRADHHRVALQYGPFVYCLEEVDNGSNLGSIVVDHTVQPRVTGHLDTLAGKLEVLGYPAHRVMRDDDEDALYRRASFSSEAVSVRAVPYCLWGNRGAGEMLVFQHLRTI